MSHEADIRTIVAQEAALVFDRFDEAEAFALGSRLRQQALNGKLPIIIDIQLWDRRLFYAALAGSSASNADWARRKINVVRMFGKSTYRMFLEQGGTEQALGARFGLSPSDYILAGGGFPIRVGSVGIVGAVAVSGLPQRQDHALVVAAIAEHLEQDPAALALPPQ